MIRAGEAVGQSAVVEHLRVTSQTVPYGTGFVVGAFQAVNCLATLIQSLRDEVRHTRPSLAI